MTTLAFYFFQQRYFIVWHILLQQQTIMKSLDEWKHTEDLDINPPTNKPNSQKTINSQTTLDFADGIGKFLDFPR